MTEINYNTDINIYPVPAVDHCIVDHHGYYKPENLSVTITDVTGRNYAPGISASEGSLRVNTSSLSAGFYMVTLTEPGKLPAFARILK